MSRFDALAKDTSPKISKVGTAITDPQKSPNTKPINELIPLFLKYTEYIDHIPEPAKKRKCPFQVSALLVFRIPYDPTKKAPNRIIINPKDLNFVGLSPTIMNANKAVQKGSMPGAKAPASEAGA